MGTAEPSIPRRQTPVFIQPTACITVPCASNIPRDAAELCIASWGRDRANFNSRETAMHSLPACSAFAFAGYVNHPCAPVVQTRACCAKRRLRMAQENDAGGAAGVKKLLALGAFGASIGPSCDALHNQVVGCIKCAAEAKSTGLAHGVDLSVCARACACVRVYV